VQVQEGTRAASVYSVFDGEPRQGLESRIGMISGAGTNDNFGESNLDTLDMHARVCCVVLGRSIES